MEFIEKELERRPVVTIMLLAIFAVAVALGLGILTPIAGWVLRGKNWTKSKFGTAPSAPASPSAPSTPAS